MNDYPDSDNFIEGEDVMVVFGAGREVRGVIRKVTTSRVTVEHGEGKIEVLHRRKYGPPFMCRRVSKHDIAREQWKTDLAVWERARPVLKHFALSRWHLFGDFYVSLAGRSTASPETMLEIADEANVLGEWLRKQPQEPRP